MGNAAQTASDEVVARALRIRRRWRIGLTTAAGGLLASALLSQWIAPAAGSSWNGQVCKIVSVEDGATVRIDNGRRIETVHLLGLDAPPAGGVYSEESKHFLTARLPAGTSLTLKTDEPQTRDAAGRLLAYVYLNDSENLNVSAVRSGAAYLDRRTRCSMQSQLELAESAARSKKTGLWAVVTRQDMPAWRQAWMEARHFKD